MQFGKKGLHDNINLRLLFRDRPSEDDHERLELFSIHFNIYAELIHHYLMIEFFKVPIFYIVLKKAFVQGHLKI